jgi:hypothetical protein
MARTTFIYESKQTHTRISRKKIRPANLISMRTGTGRQEKSFAQSLFLYFTWV